MCKRNGFWHNMINQGFITSYVYSNLITSFRLFLIPIICWELTAQLLTGPFQTFFDELDIVWIKIQYKGGLYNVILLPVPPYIIPTFYSTYPILDLIYIGPLQMFSVVWAQVLSVTSSRQQNGQRGLQNSRIV